MALRLSSWDQEAEWERSQEGTGKVTHSKVARLGIKGSYMKVKSNSLLRDSVDDVTVVLLLSGSTTLDADGPPTWNTLRIRHKETVMDGCEPAISPIGVPHSDAVSAEYLW